jgi:hypothetical protein
METIKKLSDVHLVSYLLTKGFAEIALPKKENQYVYFYFNGSPELEQEMLNFYGGKSQIDAQVFSYHLRRLHIVVGELRRGNGRNV